MKLFSLKDGKVIIDPEALTISEFKKIYDADRFPGKEMAFKELAVVFHMCDYRSPYYNYSEDNKIISIAKEIMHNEKFKLVKRHNDAITVYNDHTKTPSEELLKELIEGLYDTKDAITVVRKQLKIKLKSKDLSEVVSTTSKGVVTKLDLLVANTNTIVKTAKDISVIIKQLKELEEIIKKEKISDKAKTKGNKKLSPLESGGMR